MQHFLRPDRTRHDPDYCATLIVKYAFFYFLRNSFYNDLEFKSIAQFPDDLYTTYLTQIYGQLGFLHKLRLLAFSFLEFFLN